MTANSPTIHGSLPPPPDGTARKDRPSRWNRAPGWRFYAITAAGGFGLLWSVSYPLGHVLWFVYSTWWLVACAIVWLVRLANYVRARRTATHSGRWWPFGVAPIGGALVLGLMALGAPLSARWSTSEPAFDARADQLAAKAAKIDAGSRQSLIRDDRVALYTVSDAWVDADGAVHFLIRGSGFIDSVGVALLPEGPPADDGTRDYQRFDGDWYTFVAEF